MLISEIRDEIITEVGGDTADTALQTKVLGFIKSALRRFPQNARARSIVSKKSASLSASSQTVSTPTGFMQERALWREDSDGTRHDITVVKDTRLFNEKYRTDTVGEPEFCRIYGTTIEFHRPANAAYTIYIDCFIEIDNVAAADTWAYDSNMAEILKDGAKFYYYTYTEEENQQANFGKLFSANLVGLDSKYAREEIPDHVEEG